MLYIRILRKDSYLHIGHIHFPGIQDSSNYLKLEHCGILSLFCDMSYTCKENGKRQAFIATLSRRKRWYWILSIIMFTICHNHRYFLFMYSIGLKVNSNIYLKWLLLCQVCHSPHHIAWYLHVFIASFGISRASGSVARSLSHIPTPDLHPSPAPVCLISTIHSTLFYLSATHTRARFQGIK